MLSLAVAIYLALTADWITRGTFTYWVECGTSNRLKSELDALLAKFEPIPPPSGDYNPPSTEVLH